VPAGPMFACGAPTSCRRADEIIDDSVDAVGLDSCLVAMGIFLDFRSHYIARLDLHIEKPRGPFDLIGAKLREDRSTRHSVARHNCRQQSVDGIQLNLYYVLRGRATTKTQESQYA
jgi:hypothetical protein